MRKALTILLFSALIFGCNKDEEVTKVESSFLIEDDLSVYRTSYTISFINTSENTDVEYHWDFGDGNFSDLKNPKHSYSFSGNYNVELTVKSNKSSDKFKKELRVGDMYIYEIEVLYFDNYKYPVNKTQWDENTDATNGLPDIYFQIIKPKSDEILFTSEIIDNAESEKLPYKFKVPKVKLNNYPYFIGSTSTGLLLLDKDNNGSEIMLHNRLSGSESFDYSYDEFSRRGEFTVSRLAACKIKYVVE